MSIRNRNCYICGEVINTNDVTIVKIILDKKERNTHKTCATKYKKNQKELEQGKVKSLANDEYEHLSAWEEEGTAGELKPFDIHCPEAGSGINFHKANCELKQKTPSQKSCYGGCKSKY